ncbi:MAG: response regulator [Sediminibacterium sp.]
MTIQKWILLADDDADDSQMLEEAITAISPVAKVKVFSDGRQVVRFLDDPANQDLPCTIVLDYNMPYLTGLQVLEKIRDYPLYKHIPKLIWSTSDYSEYRDACLGKGATAYMVKPRTEKDLTLLAKKIIGHCTAGK